MNLLIPRIVPFYPCYTLIILILTLAITALSALFRFTGLNWDAGGRLHPDEALIVNGAHAVSFFSQLHPGFHDYNGFTVYLLRLTAHAVTLFTGSTYWIKNPQGLTLVGRGLSAFLSTLSVPLIISLGTLLWNKRTGIVAGILLATTPLAIQLAHFYTTESVLIFLFLLLILTCVSFTIKPSIQNLLAMSLLSGLLLATKNTAYLLLPIPIITLIRSKKLRLFPLLATGTMTSFFLFSPFSFLDIQGYLNRYKYLADVVSGRLLFDWTIQFQKTSPLFWIPNLFAAFGPIFIVGGIGALSHALYIRKNVGIVTTLAAWFLGFLLFLGFTYLKFIRYSALLVPLSALFAARLLIRKKQTTGHTLLLGIVLGSQLVWAGMYLHIYTSPHTSILASEWIAEHVPPNTTILREEWNSIIRFDTPPLSEITYSVTLHNFYTPETDGLIRERNIMLNTTDVIIIESPKIHRTVARLSDRYPHTNNFYRQLTDGSLGFLKVAQFDSYPSLGPFAIPDDWTEETWYVFDHPTVTIYARDGVCIPETHGVHCGTLLTR